jgi:arginine decarboxylase
VKKFKDAWKLGKKEFNTQYFDINKDGELIVREGNYQYNIYDLARKFDSSIKIFLPFILEERVSNLIETFYTTMKHEGYKGKYNYHFPMKVNQNKEFVLPLVTEGAHLEATSANELWVVKKMWEGENFHAKIRVLCNGPKTEQYLKLINQLQNNNLTITPIIEAAEELELLKGFKGDVGVRLNIQAKVNSHWDKKVDRFGLTEQEILDFGKIRGLKILHYHVGSQITVERDIISALKEAFGTYVKLRKIHPSLDTMDIGGGLAIPYEKKKMYGMESVVKKIVTTLKALAEEAGVPHPNIITEWGQYVAAPSQLTVFKVVGSKNVPKGMARKWYIVDGSFMNDLLDTWSIHQKWHLLPINHMDDKKKERVWLSGLTCDSDDKYASADGYVLLPRLEDLSPGEDLFIAVLDTGAYQDAFAMHHCLLSSPAKIVLQNGLVTVARKRESPEEIGRLFGW